MHQPKLECWENGRMARSMSLKGARFFIVGRNGAQADIVVAADSISRAHAAIINSSSSTFLHDLDSAHGTWYDEGGRTMHVPQLGVRLDPGGEPTKLVEGATIRFGSHAQLVFRIVGLQAETVQRWKPPAWAAPPGRRVCLEVRSNSGANPYLEHLAGGDIDETLNLTSHATTFGRKAELVEVVVPDGSISRQHAAICHSTDAESFLIDMGSASGSFVDDKRVHPDKPRELKDGSVITLGDCPTTWTFRVVRTEGGPSFGGKRKR